MVWCYYGICAINLPKYSTQDVSGHLLVGKLGRVDSQYDNTIFNRMFRFQFMKFYTKGTRKKCKRKKKYKIEN